jgi:haloacetate dehalogenase
MFDGFEVTTIEAGEVPIRVRHAGSGPPLLLLHGYPQTHAMWHLVAPALAEDFTVVATDLRGYGESGKPPSTADHWPYTKRAMAHDQVAVMKALGFERFAVCGHDRGARCAYRMALDDPHRVTRLAVLDIVPTGDMWRRADAAFGHGYWHWYFLAQPAPLPERMISAAPAVFYGSRGGRDRFAPAALAEYDRWAGDPETLHAMCEDYRAGATLDYEHDEADRTQRRRIACPVLALWGAQNFLEDWYDVLGIWRGWADDVSGRALDCGHYLPEERPDEVLAELRAFFAAGAQSPTTSEASPAG